MSGKRDVFLGKFEYVVTESGCWECTSHKARDKDGYSFVYLKDVGKNLRLHRVSYQHYKGSIPEGFVVMHKCDNPPCFNPDHLDVGTQKDNTQDMIQKGRQSSEVRSRKLTDEEVLSIFKGSGNHEELADKYNVSRSTVSHIKSGKTWGDVTGKTYKKTKFMDKETVLEVYHSEGTYREIASKFNVSCSTVSDIKNRKKFKKYLSEVSAHATT